MLGMSTGKEKAAQEANTRLKVTTENCIPMGQVLY